MPTAPIRNFQDLGVIIRAARKSRGIRQEDLSAELNFSNDYLSKIERGTPNLHISRLFRTMSRLNIRLSVTYEIDGRDGD